MDGQQPTITSEKSFAHLATDLQEPLTWLAVRRSRLGRWCQHETVETVWQNMVVMATFDGDH